MALPIATFAYTGVEIIAASIAEARWSVSPKGPQTGSDGQNGREAQDPSERGPIKHAIAAIKATAVGVPVVIAMAYTLSGLLVSLALSRREPALVRLAWIEKSTTTATDITTATSTGGAITSTPEVSDESSSSPFILIAEYLDTNGLNHPLKHVFNAFILFTALTCANTNLYVSSRTLFGITNHIRAPGGPPKYLAFLGRTDRHKVPQRAVWLSAASFYLAPFIEIWGNFGTDSQLIWLSIGRQDCKAALQLKGLYPAKNVQVAEPQAQTDQETEEFPYRNHWQPFLASLALLGCVLVLLLFNSAFLWKEFHIVPFLAGYLPIFVFLLLWLGLKVFSGSFKFKWPWFHQHTPAEVVEIFRVLNQLRKKSLMGTEAMPTGLENNGTNG
ncbi:unnamed protein product [Fusarium graminearum]|nr:unnamed protein product [Fusarium graminearum]